MEPSEEMDQRVEVPKWMFKVVSGIIATLIVITGGAITLALLWLMLLTFGVNAANRERRRANRDLINRIEKIEKSAERIEESTDPYGFGVP